MATRRNRARRQIDKSTSANPDSAPHSKFQDKSQTPDSRRLRARHDPAGDPGDGIGAPQIEQKVLAAALAMLAARSRSEAELRQRLTARFGPAAEIDRCIDQLKDRGYINDSKLAENYAAHRTGVKAMGRARLSRELSKRLLSREVIDSALNRAFQSLSEEELIDRAIEKRVRSSGVPASPADRKRMFSYLARLGFEYDLIIRKIRSLGSPGHLDLSED